MEAWKYNLGKTRSGHWAVWYPNNVYPSWLYTSFEDAKYELLTHLSKLFSKKQTAGQHGKSE